MILCTSVAMETHHKRPVAWQLGIVEQQWREEFFVSEGRA